MGYSKADKDEPEIDDLVKLKTMLVQKGEIFWNRVGPNNETIMMKAYKNKKWDHLRVMCDHGVNPKF